MNLFKSKKDKNNNINNDIKNIGINIYFDKQNLNKSLNFKINESYCLSELIEHCGKEIFSVFQFYNDNNQKPLEMNEYNFLIKDEKNPFTYIKLKPKDKILKFLKNENKNENKKLFFLNKNFSLNESIIIKNKNDYFFEEINYNNDKIPDENTILNIYKNFFQNIKIKEKIKYINVKEKNIKIYHKNKPFNNVLEINDANLIFKKNIFEEENENFDKGFEIKLIDIDKIEEINNKNELKKFNIKDNKQNLIRLKLNENSNLNKISPLFISCKEKFFYQKFINILIQRDFLVIDKKFDVKIDDNKNVTSVCTDWFLEKFFEYKYLISQKESRFLFFKIFKNNFYVDLLDRILKYQYEINNKNFIKVMELYKLIINDLNNLKIKIDNLKDPKEYFAIYQEKKGEVEIEKIFDKFIFNDVFNDLSEKILKNYFEKYKESYANKIENFDCKVNNEYVEIIKIAKFLLPLISQRFYKFCNIENNFNFLSEKIKNKNKQIDINNINLNQFEII
jgi:hypothetical protein